MIEVKGVALHVFACGQVVQGLDETLDLRETIRPRKEPKPGVKEGRPLRSHRRLHSFIRDKPECNPNLLRVPIRFRAHADLTKRPKRYALRALLLVMTLQTAYKAPN